VIALPCRVPLPPSCARRATACTNCHRLRSRSYWRWERGSHWPWRWRLPPPAPSQPWARRPISAAE